MKLLALVLAALLAAPAHAAVDTSEPIVFRATAAPSGTTGRGKVWFDTGTQTMRFRNALGAVADIGSGSGSGDVVGPASSTDEALCRFDGVTGKLLQNSNGAMDDLGDVTIIYDTTRTISFGDQAGEDGIFYASSAAESVYVGLSSTNPGQDVAFYAQGAGGSFVSFGITGILMTTQQGGLFNVVPNTADTTITTQGLTTIAVTGGGDFAVTTNAGGDIDFQPDGDVLLAPVGGDVDVTGAVVGIKTHAAFAGSRTVDETGAVETTNATPALAWVETLSDNTLYWASATCVGRDAAGVDRATYRRFVQAHRQGGGGATASTVQVDGVDIETAGAALWDITFTVSGNDLRVSVTGAAATTIAWTCEVEYQGVSTSA